MNNTYLIALGICLIIGGFIGWSLKPDKECPDTKPNTLIEYRYIDKTDTLIIPKFKTIIKKDTLRFRDTVFVHNETNYVAEHDTTYEDSSLTAHVQFVSPIPLDRRSYFNMKFGLREKTITNTIVQTEDVGFWYKRFIPYLGVGINYNGKTADVGIQMGIGIRIN